MKLFHFFQDRHWYEDVAHILIGLVPYWGWDRERRQWPPGDVITIAVNTRPDGRPMSVERVAPLDRVADAYRDFLGYAIGDIIRTAILIGLLIWRW